MKVYGELQRAQAENLSADPTGSGLITGRFWHNTTEKKYKFYNGTSVIELGEGAGGINYVPNPDFEASADNYSAYADAAGTKPVDGAGGSATLAITRTTTTSEIQRGVASGKIAKDAANRQGEGIAIDLDAFPNADLSKVMQITFDYDASHANYADDDIAIYIISSNDSFSADFNIIEPVGKDLKAGKGSHFCTFQSGASDTEYRLCFHVASTNAAAYDVFIDDIKVAPVEKFPSAAAMSDLIPFTVTFQNDTGLTISQDCTYRRVGHMAQVFLDIAMTAGPGSDGGAFGVDISAIGDIDFSGDNAMFNSYYQGTGVWQDASATTANEESAISFYTSSSSNNVITFYDNTGDATPSVGDISGTNLDNLDFIQGSFWVPIKGWSSNSQDISVVDDNRRVSVIAGLTASTANGSFANAAVEIIDFDDVQKDTHGAVTTGASWSFTAPKTSDYIISAYFTSSSATVSAGDNAGLLLHKNGSTLRQLDFDEVEGSGTGYSHFLNGTTLISLNKGDTIDVRVQNATGSAVTPVTSDRYCYITIHDHSGRNQIVADELIAFRAEDSSGQSFTASTPGDVTWNVENFDTHGAFDGTTFTAPVAGKYFFGGFVTINQWDRTGGHIANIRLAKNGTNVQIYAIEAAVTSTTNAHTPLRIDTVLDLAKGDTVKLSADVDADTGTVSLINDVDYNSFYGFKIG